MANTNINISITASDNASATIQKVEQAVSSLGKRATTSINITGLGKIDKQLSSLSSKMKGNTLDIGMSDASLKKLNAWGSTAMLMSNNVTSKMVNDITKWGNSAKSISTQTASNIIGDLNNWGATVKSIYGRESLAQLQNWGATAVGVTKNVALEMQKASAMSKLSAMSSASNKTTDLKNWGGLAMLASGNALQTQIKALQDWGATATLMTANATGGFKKFDNQLKNTASNIDNIGSRMRYLSMVTGMIFAAMAYVSYGFMKAARDMEDSQLKLMVSAQTTGTSYEDLNVAAKKLSSDGMMSQKTAYFALSKAIVATTGMSQQGVVTIGKDIKEIQTAQAIALVQMWKDSAMVMKQNLNDTTDAAIEKAAVGFVANREVAADSTGLEVDRISAEKVFIQELNNGNTALTKAQKTQAMYNAYMKEGERYAGAAALASMTFSGSLTKANASVLMMKQNLGEALVPLVGTFAVGLTQASQKIGEFAGKYPGLTMSIVTGTVALTAFITVVAALGALFNMFSGTIGKVLIGFKNINIGAILSTVGIVALTVALGGLAYAYLKLTGRWDKWKNSMTALGTKIKNSMKQITDASSEAASATNKMQKALDDVERSITKTYTDFNQQMAEWVDNHDTKIKDLKTQINDLKNSYHDATSKIKDDFNSTMDDMTLSHSRKVEDIQEQLDEEMSKGIWADQTKIKELKKELARENEDYALASTEKTDTKEEETKKEKTEYEKRLDELQTQLKKETDLEAKHSELISYYRGKPYDDEVQKMVTSYNERLEDLTRNISDIKEQYAEQTSAASGLADTLDNLTGKQEDFTETQIVSLKDGIAAWWNLQDVYTKVGLGILGTIGTIALAIGARGVLAIGLKALPKLFEKYFADAYIQSLYFADKFAKIKISPIPILLVFEWTMYWGNKIINEVSEIEKEIGSTIENAISASDYRLDLAKKLFENGVITKDEYNAIKKREANNIKQLSDDLKPVAESSWFDLWGSTWTYDNFIKSIDIQPFTKIGEWASINILDPINKVITKIGEITYITEPLGKLANNMKIWFDTSFKPSWDEKWDSVKTKLSSWASTLSINWQSIKFGFSNWFDGFKNYWANRWSELKINLSSLIEQGEISLGNAGNNISNWYDDLFRATGGNVTSSTPYIVGEKGPELFVPSSNGTIIPNNQMGGNTFNISIINPSVRSEADIKSIAQAVKDVISRELALKKFA